MNIKNLLFILLLILNLNVFSQDLSPSDSVRVVKLEKERKKHKNEGFMKLGVGIFAHIISSFQFINGIKDPMNMQPFLIYSGVGLSFDVLAIISFNKSRKLKKEINNIKNKN